MPSILPADGNIAAVLADLDRFEKQSYSNQATVKRTLRMLPLSVDRLNKSPNQMDPSWVEAKNRLDTLQSRLEGGSIASNVARPAASAPSPPPTPALAPQAPGPPPSEVTAASPSGSRTQTTTTTPAMISHERIKLKKLCRDLESSVFMLDRKRFTDPQYLKNLHSSVTTRRNQLAKYYRDFRGDTDVQAATAALEKLRLAVDNAERVGASDLRAANIESTRKEIARQQRIVEQGTALPFQDKAYYVGAIQENVTTLEQRVAPFGDGSNDSDARSLLDAFQKLQETIQSYQEVAAAVLEELGDFRAELKVATKVGKAPRVPMAPYSAESITDFFTKATTYQELANKSLVTVTKIQEKAYLPEVEERNRVKSILWNLQSELQTLERDILTVSSSMETIIEHVESTLGWLDEKDPTNSLDQANIFIGKKGQYQLERLGKEMDSARAGLAYAKVYKSSKKVEYEGLVDRVEATRRMFEEGIQEAYKSVRMPKPTQPSSGSMSYEELEKIARETLSNPKYEVGEILRLVVNTEKRKKTRQEKELTVTDVDASSYSGKVTINGTERITTWVWEEFQVATAEPDGDKFYIYYSTLKYFTSGSSVTPLDRWVIGERHQWNEIPFENIEKD